MKHFTTLIFILFSTSLCSATHIDSILTKLDNIIEERQYYAEKKQKELDRIKELIPLANNQEQLLTIYNQLISGFMPFNNDSSLYYVNKSMEIALQLGEQRFIDEANLNQAEVFCIAGMYQNALNILEKIDTSRLNNSLKDMYYRVNGKMYKLMADHSVSDTEIEKYKELADLYRDSLLIINGKPESLSYIQIKADQDITNGRAEQALSSLLKHINEVEQYSHFYAIFTYCIAEAYEITGDKQNAIYYYAKSAISDIMCGVKEYVSLKRLIVLLFEEEQVDRAYNYAKCSMEDAVLSKARIHTYETIEIFPLLDRAYQSKVKKQKTLVQRFLISSMLLSIFLLAAIIYIYRQMRKLAVARKREKIASDKLNDFNKKLQESNLQLKETNQALAETNQVKERYIVRYMDQCSEYLDKLDSYRRSLSNLVAAGKMEELRKTIKSDHFIEEEFETFYAGFDMTFLELFPNFVDDFNSLLAEKIHPKPNELLNTELRIFALICLGITDSVKIAQFLRYSLTTIYNYRTRVRNKALGKRDDFEKKVMLIARKPYTFRSLDYLPKEQVLN